MNRFTRRDVASLLKPTSNNDEDQLYERQALIDDLELHNDDNDSLSRFGIRHRQRVHKSKSASRISDSPTCEEQELKSINGSNDNIHNCNSGSRNLNSEPIVEFTHYDIQPGDTLHSICLRYACSVNLVKRLNGLISDQEFYGLTRIKLPLGKLGLLEDILKTQQQRQESELPPPGPSPSPSRIVNSPGSALSISTRHGPQFEPLLINFIKADSESHVGVESLLETGNDNVEKVFEDIDYQVERAKAAAENYDKKAAEIADRIDINGVSSNYNIQHRAKVSKIPQIFFCDENFGLNYKKLLVFIFVVCFVVPLVYLNQASIVTR